MLTTSKFSSSFSLDSQESKVDPSCSTT
jgi:hypothetical protein